jgi:hypothetical protein
VNGPFRAGENDMAIFKKPDGLMTRIPQGKKVIADEGYRGEPWMLATKNPLDSSDLKDFKGRAKGRHESFNSRLKQFGILAQTFRGKGPTRMDQHQRAFEACCVVSQYNMENGDPLFEV